MPSPPEDETAVTDLSERELYQLIHRATRDAVLDAVGTVIIAGLGLILFVTGLSLGVGSLDVGGLVFGGLLVLAGVVLMLSPLDLFPSVRELA